MALGAGGDASIDRLIGAAITRRRIEVGVSSKELAAELGISVGQLERYETGTDRVRAEALMAVCKALNVRPRYFFDALSAVAPGERN